ncbi:hypothetical protein N7462_010456 [Penicillium macrosclerotiorum]|uniref:uncharacterized protein n=1 Tax=Penicillium macrosclerotiorum TaxID=303699 RepID=UPI002546B859|nr:uncharacterized protein N7462_010456 [Penicillium macrosclerotiorum]KAJ5669386.1 hypothetical protein N7462_010456 [Penicillium macrosclerotiorum]
MMDISEFDKTLPVSKEVRLPKHPFSTIADDPCRFEAEVYNYFAWAPLYEDDTFANGDGCIDAVRIQDGHADFKQRYVRTERFVIERAARQAVFGKYRNRYTDDPRVKHKIHSTANTHIIYFENQLLALKEDSLPYALNPDTLATKGPYDFHGHFSSKTHTAHPKIDHATGEMITMGYEAKGDSTTDIVYYLFDKNGNKLEECWISAPFAGMMHDMAATDKWIVFVLPPLAIVPLDLLEKGHHHFAWDEEKPLMLGILPRRNPKPEDVWWFSTKSAFLGHTGNAFDGEDGCFWFFPPIGKPPIPPQTPLQDMHGGYVRFKLDPNAADTTVKPTKLIDLAGEMPKVDDRYLTKQYNNVFMCHHATLSGEPSTGGAWNSISRCDLATGEYTHWCAGPSTVLEEVAFIPRSPDAPESDGYVITMACRQDKFITSILILDTAKLAEGPIAMIELPFRLRLGIHGSWVPAERLPERKELCDMEGVTDEILQEFQNKSVTIPKLSYTAMPPFHPPPKAFPRPPGGPPGPPGAPKQPPGPPHHPPGDPPSENSDFK